MFLAVVGISAWLGTGCNNRGKEHEEQATTPLVTDSVSVKTDAHYYWEVNPNGRTGVEMMKTTPISPDSMSVEMMLSRFNATYPEIQLQYSRVSNDTLFLKIKKASYLTQQMGSSGAAGYLAELTYNFTELNAINFVALSFKAGDHASPGIYSRTDFVK